MLPNFAIDKMFQGVNLLQGSNIINLRFCNYIISLIYIKMSVPADINSTPRGISVQSRIMEDRKIRKII